MRATEFEAMVFEPRAEQELPGAAPAGAAVVARAAARTGTTRVARFMDRWSTRLRRRASDHREYSGGVRADARGRGRAARTAVADGVAHAPVTARGHDHRRRHEARVAARRVPA